MDMETQLIYEARFVKPSLYYFTLAVSGMRAKAEAASGLFQICAENIHMSSRLCT